jgi:hypothetical protein
MTLTLTLLDYETPLSTTCQTKSRYYNEVICYQKGKNEREQPNLSGCDGFKIHSDIIYLQIPRVKNVLSVKLQEMG